MDIDADAARAMECSELPTAPRGQREIPEVRPPGADAFSFKMFQMPIKAMEKILAHKAYVF